jgi:hypothetical protein
MKYRVIVACLLFCAPLAAREKTDVIIMKNGDHLTGQIRGLNGGVLYFDLDYILGTSSVQWSQVDHIESRQLFLVKTEQGSVYTGKLSTAETGDGRPVTIEVVQSEDRSVPLQRDQVVTMDQTSDRFLQRFSGSVNTGVSYTKGNQSSQFNLSSDVTYPAERWQAAASYNTTVAGSTGATTTTRNQFSVGALHRLPWNQWFYAGLGNLMQSSEQGIDLQSAILGGLGRYLANTNHATIYLVGGFGWQRTTYSQSLVGVPDQNVATAMLYGSAKLFRFNRTDLNVTGYVFPALSTPGRVYSNLNVTYYVKLVSNLRWNVSFYGNWDNQPPPTFSGSDYGTSSGLSLTFGNR